MPDTYLAAPRTAAAPDAAVDATTVDEAPAGVTPATTPAPVAAAPADELNVTAVPQVTPPVPEAEAVPEANGLAEVIVTAQRRPQSAQEEHGRASCSARGGKQGYDRVVPVSIKK